MKHLLLTTIAAVLLVGCGESQSPEVPTAEAPDISIHKAAADGNIEAVKQHITAGADVNAKTVNAETVNDMTPLHLAAFWGRKEVAELLIANGADVNENKSGGGTPMDHAKQANQKVTVDLLRKHGGKTGEELKAEEK